METPEKYYCHRLLDSSGELLGYRADSLGSLSKDWGKVYSSLSTAQRVSEFAHRSTHKRVADALSKVNAGAADLLRGADTRSINKTATVELLELHAGSEFNYSAYSREDFAKLLRTAKVLETKNVTQ
jgi:hypothetical protein